MGLDRAEQCLLPNEDVRLTCQTKNGSLILTDRRIAIMNEKSRSGVYIEQAIPYDCALSIKSKKDHRFEFSGKVLDHFGKDTGRTKSFEIEAPKGDVSEFQSTMKQCSDFIDEIRGSDILSPDLTYLEKMPGTLTQNAVLDINTVLRDQPVHDELVHEALKFLGDRPFILEESLRDGMDRENGVLFAVGKQGYYWIQGRKKGRFMSNVIVDTVEWENFQSLTYQWHTENAIIYATYSPTKAGNIITKEYLWSPSVNDDTIKYPWLLQELNGPWILADVMSKYSGKQRFSSFY